MKNTQISSLPHDHNESPGEFGNNQKAFKAQNATKRSRTDSATGLKTYQKESQIDNDSIWSFSRQHIF